jgi:hypothetical protein
MPNVASAFRNESAKAREAGSRRQFGEMRIESGNAMLIVAAAPAVSAAASFNESVLAIQPAQGTSEGSQGSDGGLGAVDAGGMTSSTSASSSAALTSLLVGAVGVVVAVLCFVALAPVAKCTRSRWPALAVARPASTARLVGEKPF